MVGWLVEVEEEAGSGSSPARNDGEVNQTSHRSLVAWSSLSLSNWKHKHKHGMRTNQKVPPVTALKSMQSSQGRPFLSRHFLGLASAHQPAPSCSRHLMHLPGAISIAQFRNLTKVCLDPASSSASCFSSSLLQRCICHSLFSFPAPSSASFCC